MDGTPSNRLSSDKTEPEFVNGSAIPQPVVCQDLLRTPGEAKCCSKQERFGERMYIVKSEQVSRALVGPPHRGRRSYEAVIRDALFHSCEYLALIRLFSLNLWSILMSNWSLGYLLARR